MVAGGTDTTIGSPKVGDFIILKSKLRVELIRTHMIDRK